MNINFFKFQFALSSLLLLSAPMASAKDSLASRVTELQTILESPGVLKEAPYGQDENLTYEATVDSIYVGKKESVGQIIEDEIKTLVKDYLPPKTETLQLNKLLDLWPDTGFTLWSGHPNREANREFLLTQLIRQDSFLKVKEILDREDTVLWDFVRFQFVDNSAELIGRELFFINVVYAHKMLVIRIDYSEG